MATYAELYALQRDQDELLHKVAVATWVAAEAVRVEAVGTANHAKRMIWAAGVLDGGEIEAEKMLRIILAGNRAATTAAILGASDSAIQGKVDAAVNLLAGI